MIVMEKGHALLVCIAVATFSSLFSARFANRVRGRTVGLVTGMVLTVLGAGMLILKYWEALSRVSLFMDVLTCFGTLLVYIFFGALALFPMRLLTGLPSFIFRKLLHVIAFTCVPVMILSARSWQAAALTSIIFAVLTYPLLMLAEHEPWYPHVFVEKKPGEIKRSMLMLFIMFVALTAICWGIIGRPGLAATTILMWGMGDMAAALVGIPFGKHKVQSRLTDGKKSWEGSATMLLVSAIAGTAMLMMAERLDFPHALLCALPVALAGTITELFSPGEYDTVTVPAVIAMALLILVRV